MDSSPHQKNSLHSALFCPRVLLFFLEFVPVHIIRVDICQDFKLRYKNPGISPEFEMLKLTMTRANCSEIPE